MGKAQGSSGESATINKESKMIDTLIMFLMLTFSTAVLLGVFYMMVDKDKEYIKHKDDKKETAR